jgi:hypothetical protein
MELRERKYGFIKHNIARNVDSTSTGIQTFIPFVRRTIAQEDTLGSKLEFMSIVRSEMRPTCIAEDFEPCVVRLCTKQLLKGRDKIKDTRG